jgi:hypothetical protein
MMYVYWIADMPMVVQEPVELTQVHPLFQHLYNFPS